MASNRLLDLMAKTLVAQHWESVFWERAEGVRKASPYAGMSDTEGDLREQAAKWREAGAHHRAMFVAQLAHFVGASPEALIEIDLSQYLLREG